MSNPSPVIASNRVEGTPVYDLHGKRIGTIRYLVIEKISGRVVNAVMTFGGFLGFGTHPYSIPWEKLKFDTTLNGYRTDIVGSQLGDPPASSGDDEIWPDHKSEKDSHDDWDIPPFRGV
jgi:sporulation protein YlmC with PRC-barrel domain